MPGYSPTTPIDHRVEMFQKAHPKDAFFNMRQQAARPMSDATEMFDTDFEDDESEIEDSNSPRLSINSSGQQSETTISSYEEIHTPSPDSHEFKGFDFGLAAKISVEGPRGPHLFRSSVDSIALQEEQYALDMSPMTPRPSSAQRKALDAPRVPEIPARHRPLSSLTDAVESLNLNEVTLWTPRQVARWMYDAGFEPSIVEKFEENDISGAILTTLKFEDLRELDIPSFGQRTKVWNEIHLLRGSASNTPKPATPIEEVASPCVDSRGEFRRPRNHSSRRRDESVDCGSGEDLRRRKSSRRRQRRPSPDDITPLESVSIVGIEQVMPKPHKCAKGENCSKWRRQQRLIRQFKQEHPMSNECGAVWVAGDPGNPMTAEAIIETTRPISPRPVSDAVPSVVASSDVLGPTLPAFRHLEEASLRSIQSRDPQENVKQFLKFQHVDPQPVTWSAEEPATPPYEMFPAIHTGQPASAYPAHRTSTAPPRTNTAPPTTQNLQAGLRGLPKLAIPGAAPSRQSPSRAANSNSFAPYRMDRAEAAAPDLRNNTTSPSAFYRFGTPFSEMDIPVTAIPVGPVPREASQSVPPNMNYRSEPSAPQRTQSRVSRRPSFPAMPRLDENHSTTLPPQDRFKPIRAPEQAWSGGNQPIERNLDDVAYAGNMKKRKTKMLRHEWQEHHFTLKGTRLAMHKDAHAMETLEYIDVDDYAIACSSLASGSKLNAAFKAMNISRDKKDKKDEAAFAFQLIPASADKSVRLRKRESTMAANGQSEGKDAGAKGKTHYFAVKSRDERIDWMRELMLAKALKQKSEGFEININGNMI